MGGVTLSTATAVASPPMPPEDPEDLDASDMLDSGVHIALSVAGTVAGGVAGAAACAPFPPAVPYCAWVASSAGAGLGEVMASRVLSQETSKSGVAVAVVATAVAGPLGRAAAAAVATERAAVQAGMRMVFNGTTALGVSGAVTYHATGDKAQAFDAATKFSTFLTGAALGEAGHQLQQRLIPAFSRWTSEPQHTAPSANPPPASTAKTSAVSPALETTVRIPAGPAPSEPVTSPGSPLATGSKAPATYFDWFRPERPPGMTPRETWACDQIEMRLRSMPFNFNETVLPPPFIRVDATGRATLAPQAFLDHLAAQASRHPTNLYDAYPPSRPPNLTPRQVWACEQIEAQMKATEHRDNWTILPPAHVNDFWRKPVLDPDSFLREFDALATRAAAPVRPPTETALASPRTVTPPATETTFVRSSSAPSASRQPVEHNLYDAIKPARPANLTPRQVWACEQIEAQMKATEHRTGWALLPPEHVDNVWIKPTLNPDSFLRALDAREAVPAPHPSGPKTPPEE